MTPFRDRKIDHSKQVRVYRNLHHGGYSVAQDSLVVAHTNEITLRNCKMHVCERARQRVIANRRKEVHAWVTGFMDADTIEPTEANLLRYCRYVAGCFRDVHDQPVRGADLVSFARKVGFRKVVDPTGETDRESNREGWTTLMLMNNLAARPEFPTTRVSAKKIERVIIATSNSPRGLLRWFA